MHKFAPQGAVGSKLLAGTICNINYIKEGYILPMYHIIYYLYHNDRCGLNHNKLVTKYQVPQEIATKRDLNHKKVMVSSENIKLDIFREVVVNAFFYLICFKKILTNTIYDVLSVKLKFMSKIIPKGPWKKNSWE